MHKERIWSVSRVSTKWQGDVDQGENRSLATANTTLSFFDWCVLPMLLEVPVVPKKKKILSQPQGGRKKGMVDQGETKRGRGETGKACRLLRVRAGTWDSDSGAKIFFVLFCCCCCVCKLRFCSFAPLFVGSEADY